MNDVPRHSSLRRGLSEINAAYIDVISSMMLKLFHHESSKSIKSVGLVSVHRNADPYRVPEIHYACYLW